MFKWDPELYSRFLKERTQPAIDLAAAIDLQAPVSAIDIGCGPGNSTRVLADRFPGLRVTGADLSESMIKTAKENYPRFEFMRLDAATELPSLKEKYDIVFSNACIQWIPDHHSLVPAMFGALKEGGVLAVQIPVNYEEPIHRIIRDLSESAKWRSKLSGARSILALSEGEYFDILSSCTKKFAIWKTIYMHRMPSHESIMDWYRGTGMRPYLDKLDDSEKAMFESDVLKEVRKAYPVQQNGEIIFRFPRLLFTAKRV